MFADWDPQVILSIYNKVGQNKDLTAASILNGGIVSVKANTNREKAVDISFEFDQYETTFGGSITVKIVNTWDHTVDVGIRTVEDTAKGF